MDGGGFSGPSSKHDTAGRELQFDHSFTPDSAQKVPPMYLYFTQSLLPELFLIKTAIFYSNGNLQQEIKTNYYGKP